MQSFPIGPFSKYLFLLFRASFLDGWERYSQDSKFHTTDFAENMSGQPHHTQTDNIL